MAGKYTPLPYTGTGGWNGLEQGVETPSGALACCFCRRLAFTIVLGFALCNDGPEVGGVNCMDRAREMFRLSVHEALRTPSASGA